MLPLDALDANRIALIKPSALGDIIHCLPLLTALRRRFPKAHLAWIVNRSYAPLLEGYPDLDEVIAFERGALRQGLWQSAQLMGGFLGRLRASRFDLVLDMQGLLRSGFMCLASGAGRRVGLSSAREGARFAYTDVVSVPDVDNIHAVDRYLLAARALGCVSEPLFHLPVPTEAQQAAARLLGEVARPLLLFAVGSRWVTKRWPPGHFAALGRRAQSLFGGTAVFVGGPEDKPLALAAAAELHGPTLDLTGQTSLPVLAAVLDQADVVIANDTGPLHLAVALGRPVVAPYTCTRVVLTGPYGAFSQAVESRVWCQGSCLKRCSRMECMDELTPDRLWPVLQRTLEGWQSSSRSA
jgi:heptosyltransferase I